uniref:Uncharacterized protein n=1 Tax=Timema monikensis TaxID=170555 RepID=A0A7R9HW54_9NEOP|nr:unnamed protein product [Timema monikensis]
MITSVSCFSESDKDTSRIAQRRDSVRTESSYKLIEENISLINKLRLKEDICRKLENEIEDLEGEIDNVAKTHKEELEKLRIEESDLQMQDEVPTWITLGLRSKYYAGCPQHKAWLIPLSLLTTYCLPAPYYQTLLATHCPATNRAVLMIIGRNGFLNVCKGVVTCYDLDCVSIEDLEAGLSQEQLVKKLRNRIEELEQWQERLEREGDTLQVK